MQPRTDQEIVGRAGTDPQPNPNHQPVAAVIAQQAAPQQLRALSNGAPLIGGENLSQDSLCEDFDKYIEKTVMSIFSKAEMVKGNMEDKLRNVIGGKRKTLKKRRSTLRNKNKTMKGI